MSALQQAEGCESKPEVQQPIMINRQAQTILTAAFNTNLFRRPEEFVETENTI